MPKPPALRPQDLALGILNAPTLEIPHTKQTITPNTDLSFNENDQSFYYYSSGTWLILDGANITIGPLARFIHQAIDENFPEAPISDAKIKETITSLARLIPLRITRTSPPPFIVFNNGTLNLDTLQLLPHDRAHQAVFHLPFDWPTTDLSHPNFDAYTLRSFSDPEAQLLLKQMIGYYLTPYDEEPAVFFIFGEARTGKSTIVEFLQALFTPTFASSFSLESLTTNDTYVAELAGKLANIKDEDESERISGDKFKLLADHGTMQARRLYQAPYSFKPYAKFLFSSNDLPNFKNIEGVTRRLHFLKFSNPLPIKDQDKSFDKKLLAEAPQIVRTCLKAFKEVQAQNFEFIDPKTSQETKDELILTAHPERVFVQEWTLPITSSNEDEWTPNHLLYDAYSRFCREKNHRALNDRNFHRRLLSIPGILASNKNGVRSKNIQLKYSLGTGITAQQTPLV